MMVCLVGLVYRLRSEQTEDVSSMVCYQISVLSLELSWLGSVYSTQMPMGKLNVMLE